MPPRADPATKSYREVFVGNAPRIARWIVSRTSSTQLYDDWVSLHLDVLTTAWWRAVELQILLRGVRHSRGDDQRVKYEWIPLGDITLNIKPPTGANSKKGNAEVLLFTWENLLRKWMSGEAACGARSIDSYYLHQHFSEASRWV